MKESKGYRQIVRATGIFGGVQVFNILIGIVKSKIIAVLLGPSGVGCIGLLTNATSFITSVTTFGLNTSAVKEISEANASEDRDRIAETITTFRKMVLLTGLFGVVLTLALSPWLSEWSFGSKDNTWMFVVLSIVLFFQAQNMGQLVLLQGLRKIKDLAKANMVGSSLGLLFSIPLYYFFGISGIAPSLVLAALGSLVGSWYYSRQIDVDRVNIPYRIVLSKSSEMVKLGLVIAYSSILVTGVNYLVRIYISYKGGISDVGLYQAGWAIVNGYVGMVFTAMATDYFPRLAAEKDSNSQITAIANQQSVVAILILGPILVGLLIFLPLIIRILYTPKFLSIEGMIQWSLLGIFFKGLSWALGFVIIAKGARRSFLMSESLANVIILITSILGYYIFGIKGLGIAFFVSYFLYYFIVLYICGTSFSYKPSVLLLRSSLFFVVLYLAGWIVQVEVVNSYLRISLVVAVLAVASIYSLYWFNRLIGLSSLLSKKK